MDVNRKMYFMRKRLGFDQMRSGIIMLMSLFIKNGPEVSSAGHWAEEKSRLCSAPGVEDAIAACYLFPRPDH